jgi:hypothetical protein
MKLLGDATKRDDRQVLAPAAVLDTQLDHGTRSPSNERVRPGARRPTRPPSRGFVGPDVAMITTPLRVKKVLVL